MSTFITRKNRNPLPSKLGEGVGASLLFHVVVVAAFTVKFIFFPDVPLSLESAIRVDIVGLPDKMQEIPAPQIAPPITPPKETAPPVTEKMPDKPKQDDAINLNKTKSKQNEALDKLKKLSAIEQIKKSLESESKPAQIKGNVISAGTSLTGVNKLQHDQYQSLLNDHVKQHWAAPEWLSNKKLKARALVKFDQSGILIEKKIIISSGNSEFDALALTALEKSTPLPAPPEKFLDIVRYNGVVVEFGGE